MGTLVILGAILILCLVFGGGNIFKNGGGGGNSGNSGSSGGSSGSTGGDGGAA